MRWVSRGVGYSFLTAFLFGAALEAAAQTAGTFMPAGSMIRPRASHTATLLLDGRVLIVGGDETGTAELYDPTTGTFTPTGRGTTGHGAFKGVWIRRSVATLLNDGRVLIAGSDKSELYDPTTGTFTATGSMVTNQTGFTASLLTNGKVLITGGANGSTYCCIAANPELYDPTTGSFRLAGPYTEMPVEIFPDGSSAGTSGLTYAAATSLADGKILILSEPAAEVYDPVTNIFSVTGSMVAVDEGNFWGKPTQIGERTATLMANEKVLVSGGAPAYYDTGDSPLSRAELYDPEAGTFAATSSMHTRRAGHMATLLPDGTVLTTGGITDGFYSGTASAELYSPSMGAFFEVGNMNAARGFHQATLLRDGRVLITGGLTSNTYPNYQTLASAELYTPAVLVPPPVASDFQFDRTNVVAGSSYSVNISGSNLTSETFFDIRYSGPGNNASDVVLNWQRGVTASHGVPAGTAPGIWTIDGVRPHQIETDHTGSFFPVSATIRVSQ